MIENTRATAVVSAKKGLGFRAQRANQVLLSGARRVAAEIAGLSNQVPLLTLSFSDQGIKVLGAQERVLDNTAGLGAALCPSLSYLKFQVPLTEDEVFGVLQGTLLKPKCLLPETLTPYGISPEKEEGEEFSLPMTWSSYQDMLYPARFSFEEALNVSLPLVWAGAMLGLVTGAFFPAYALSLFIGLPTALFIGRNILYPLELFTRKIMQKNHLASGFQHLFGAVAGEEKVSVRRIAFIITGIQDGSLRVRIAESLPPDLLAKVLSRWSLEGGKYNQLRGVLAKKTGNPKVLAALSSWRSLGIQIAVAQNPVTPLEILEKLFNPQSPNRLSDEAAKNPNASAEMIALHLSNLCDLVEETEKEGFYKEVLLFLAERGRFKEVMAKMETIDKALFGALNERKN